MTIPNGSVLATIEELELLGADDAAIDLQRRIWASLPAETRAEQESLSETSHEEFEASFANMVVQPTITPLVSQASCPSNATPPYTIKHGVTYHCFGGTAGTVKLAKTLHAGGGSYSLAVQAAKAKGRFGYENSGFYWSTTRGPNDNTWYAWNFQWYETILVTHVQFL